MKMTGKENAQTNVSARLAAVEYGKLVRMSEIEERSMAQIIRRLILAKIRHFEAAGVL